MRPRLWPYLFPHVLLLTSCTPIFTEYSIYLVIILLASLLYFSVVSRWSCPNLLKKTLNTVLVLSVLKPVNQIQTRPTSTFKTLPLKKSLLRYKKPQRTFFDISKYKPSCSEIPPSYVSEFLCDQVPTILDDWALPLQAPCTPSLAHKFPVQKS